MKRGNLNILNNFGFKKEKPAVAQVAKEKTCNSPVFARLACFITKLASYTSAALCPIFVREFTVIAPGTICQACVILVFWIFNSRCVVIRNISVDIGCPICDDSARWARSALACPPIGICSRVASYAARLIA